MIKNSNTKVVIEFIKEFIGKYPRTIKLDTRISEDLGLDGDDASEFLITFSKRFNVDISKFPFEKYFSDEGINLLTLTVELFRKKKYFTLTVRDLVIAMEEGMLYESSYYQM